MKIHLVINKTQYPDILGFGLYCFIYDSGIAQYYRKNMQSLFTRADGKRWDL